jgi:anti-anti-sigma factor
MVSAEKLSSFVRDGEAFAARVTGGPHAVTVQFTGEFDLTAEDTANEAIDAAWATCRAVVIDLRGVTFMALAGLKTLLAAQVAADAGGRQLGLRLGAPARRVLELCDVLPRFRLLDGDGEPLR